MTLNLTLTNKQLQIKKAERTTFGHIKKGKNC